MAQADSSPTPNSPSIAAGQTARLKLTVASIEKLKPAQHRREIPDAKAPGLYLLVQPLPSGKKSWALRYRATEGQVRKQRKLTIGSYPAIDLVTARDEARKYMIEVQRGKDPAREKREKKREERRKKKLGPIGELATDDFVSVARTFMRLHVMKYNRSWRHVARSLGLVKRKDEPGTFDAIEGGLVWRWDKRKIHEITRTDIVMLLDDIVERAPVGANRALAHVRKLFNWAAERALVADNPCRGVKPRTRENQRDRVLSDGELKAVWRAAEAEKSPFGPITRLLILTGQRREEVAGMRWRELDLDNKLWTLPGDRTKNKTTHTVPLSKAVLEIIETIQQSKNVDLLFTTNGELPVKGFSRFKERLDKAAGVRGWRLHDIRRTVATGLQRLGIRLEVTEKVLNHKSGSFAGIVGVYQQHPYSEEKCAALEAWGKLVTAIVTDKPTGNVVPLREKSISR